MKPNIAVGRALSPRNNGRAMTKKEEIAPRPPPRKKVFFLEGKKGHQKLNRE
jgi:hypothetical protein